MVPAQSRIKIDSFCQVRGNPADPRNNTAYLRISSSIGGEHQDREQIIQIKIGDTAYFGSFRHENIRWHGRRSYLFSNMHGMVGMILFQ